MVEINGENIHTKTHQPMSPQTLKSLLDTELFRFPRAHAGNACEIPGAKLDEYFLVNVK